MDLNWEERCYSHFIIVSINCNKHEIHKEDDMEEKANNKMGVKHSQTEENFLTLVILLLEVSMQ